ncbi:uncharacterized protein [Aegilops tauschii subsp. strangulata]|uniref:uncharacterized protein n=1 Tax=Aegilops tauschii subsp. strangulata TaxID=200361 RepID=UPI003CC84A31
MYQSNQARIKKEIPSLLPGRGQKALGRPSRAFLLAATIIIWYQLSRIRSMSSPPPTSSHLPPPHTYPPPPASSTALLPHTAGAPALGVLASSGAIAPYAPAPPALVLTPKHMIAAILELRQAVAGIRAFLVGPYAPQPHPQQPPPPPPHQQQLPLLPPPSTATTAPVISYQYGMPYDGTATTSFPSASPPSQGVPIQQIKFPLSPSPLPSWIGTRHVSAAVRLQAAARGLLARRRVRKMRGLQLPLLQIALRCAKDLDLIRCVRDLGHAVSPTGSGHAVFPAGSDLKVCDIGGWGRTPPRHSPSQALHSSLCGADQ